MPRIFGIFGAILDLKYSICGTKHQSYLAEEKNKVHFLICLKMLKPDAPSNEKPILTEAPKFVREIPNGKLYTVSTGNNEMSIAHVWASGRK